MNPSILQTFAYGPFEGREKNGSHTLLRYLEEQNLERLLWRSQIMQVRWPEPQQALDEISKLQEPLFALAFGEGQKEQIAIETCGVNEQKGCDIDGLSYESQVIAEGKAMKRHSQLKVSLEELQHEAPWPMHISQDAGRFLCNKILYLGLEFFKGKMLFIHLPPQQTTSNQDYIEQHLPWCLKLIQQIYNLNFKKKLTNH